MPGYGYSQQAATLDNYEADWVKSRIRHRIVAEPECRDPKKRAQLEQDAEAWLRFYFRSAYDRPFNEAHQAIIKSVVEAAKSGGRFAMAAPRGIGKSTLLAGLALFLKLSGLVKFPGYLPWDEKEKIEGLEFWKNALCFNDRLAAYYPQYCTPFVASAGSSQKLRSLLKEDGKPWGGRLIISQGKIVFPGGRGVIGSRTLNGNPRGLRHNTWDGRTLRPDFLMIDDPQDRETAVSEIRVSKAIKKIDADISFMGRFGEKLPLIMACTIIQSGDVADHYVHHAGWDSICVALISKWPEGWEDLEADSFRRCREFGDIVNSSEHKRDKGKAARAYYKEHKAVMTKGMEVIDANAYDKKNKQPDALYAALEAYYLAGPEAFMAEYQNAPLKQGESIYELTPQLICSRTNDRPAYSVPDWAKLTIVGTDLNDYGLHSVAVSFGNDQSAAVVWYKRFDRKGRPICNKTMTTKQKNDAFYEALVEHGKEVANLPLQKEGKKVDVDLWVIDRPYPKPDLVHGFCNDYRKRLGIPIIPAWGVDFTKYRPFGKYIVGKPREQCHLWEWPTGQGIAWNVDYWREIAQRAWLGSVGAPGACSIFNGRHREFADHICRWKLVERIEGKSGMFWKWSTAPGWHDYGAAYYMTFVGAAMKGIGTSGEVARPRQQRRRGIRHVKV